MKITIEVEGNTGNMTIEGPFFTSTVTQTLRAMADQVDNWVDHVQQRPGEPFIITAPLLG